MSFVGKVLWNTVKILVVLAGLALVFDVLITARIWSGDWTGYFLKRGQWLEIVFVSLIVAALSTVVLKLYQWHLRLETR